MASLGSRASAAGFSGFPLRLPSGLPAEPWLPGGSQGAVGPTGAPTGGVAMGAEATGGTTGAEATGAEATGGVAAAAAATPPETRP